MTHPDKIILLVEECENLQSASAHLQFSIARTRELIQHVKEEVSPEELERLESLASRFARLADMLIQRVMRLVDEIELTPSGSVLDRIYRAEKRGWIARADVLVRIRELRNLIAHEYAADKMAEIYEAVFMLAPELDKIAKQASDYSMSLIKRVQAP
ncbi:MAG: HepT-like ribonuclease domain-containing protein [Thiobacillaceae bacterium]